MIVELTTITDINGQTLTIQGEHNGIPIRQVEEVPGEFVDVFRFHLLRFINNTGTAWTLRVIDQNGPEVDLRILGKTESHRGLSPLDPEAKPFESYNVSFSVSRPLP